MLLMIDNYDSFTYNIVQYFGELNQEVKVVRNDQVTLEDIERWQPKYLVIGPMVLALQVKLVFQFLQLITLPEKFHCLACV